MSLLIKYRENFILNPEYHSWQWAKVCPTREGFSLETKYLKIPDERARSIIRREGLVCVEKDKTMEIWDTPERDFQKTFKYKIRVTDL